MVAGSRPLLPPEQGPSGGSALESRLQQVGSPGLLPGALRGGEPPRFPEVGAQTKAREHTGRSWSPRGHSFILLFSPRSTCPAGTQADSASEQAKEQRTPDSFVRLLTQKPEPRLSSRNHRRTDGHEHAMWAGSQGSLGWRGARGGPLPSGPVRSHPGPVALLGFLLQRRDPRPLGGGRSHKTGAGSHRRLRAPLARSRAARRAEWGVPCGALSAPLLWSFLVPPTRGLGSHLLRTGFGGIRADGNRKPLAACTPGA